MPVFTYFVSPLFSALSRKHEFEADEFAKSNSDYRALISALVNMYRDNARTRCIPCFTILILQLRSA
jgi:STE24 endopeptidase